MGFARKGDMVLPDVEGMVFAGPRPIPLRRGLYSIERGRMSIAISQFNRIRFRTPLPIFGIAVLTAVAGLIGNRGSTVEAQSTARPVMLDQNLAIRTEVGGLITPISIAFLGPNDGMLVLEKQTGQVKRIVNRAVHSI